MVEAAERTKRVVAGGHPAPLQRDSEGGGRVRALGRHRPSDRRQVATTSETSGRNGIGNPPDGDPPSAKEWDQWLGPAPKVPYNKNRAYYKFRWFYNYSGGQLTNFGVHNIDMIRWCLGMDIRSAWRRWAASTAVKDNREIPDTLEVIWDYDGTLVTFSQYNANARARRSCGAPRSNCAAPKERCTSERRLGGRAGAGNRHLAFYDHAPGYGTARA